MAAAQRVPRAVAGKVGIDEAVGQMFVAPVGNTQSSGLNNVFHGNAAVFDQQLFRVEALGIPARHFQPERLAQQGLPGAQAFVGAGPAAGVGVVHLHLRQAVVVADGIDPRVGRLDQVRRIIPVRSDLTDGTTWQG